MGFMFGSFCCFIRGVVICFFGISAKIESQVIIGKVM